MQKEPIKKDVFHKKYNNVELKEHIESQVNNLQFQEHCNQVAKNLDVDPIVVKELLLHNSFLVLSLLQKNVLKNKVIKINITGYFRLVTTLIKYKLSHLKERTKGRIY